MTYRDLLYKATRLCDKGEITLGEYEEMTKPLDREVEQEPRKGHWIDTDEWRETVDGFEQWGYFRKCSKCGYVFKFLEIDNFCPNCGSDNREVEE